MKHTEVCRRLLGYLKIYFLLGYYSLAACFIGILVPDFSILFDFAGISYDKNHGKCNA